MNKATRFSTEDTRMLSIDQAMAYTGRGRNSCRTWCDEIGATRHYGRAVRYDKKVIDAALDAEAAQEA